MTMEPYIIASCTDVGVARQVNEDSMITFDSPNGRVVAVCDGMGGQAAGDLASQLACSIIRDILENNTFNTPAEAITTAIMAANQGILHRASQEPELAGMGATCVLVIIREGMVFYGWVGDSRIYYVANHTIRQISRDQSYVQQLVDRGEITPEQAEHHPQKNEILNALGVAGMTPPEIGMPLNPEPGSVVVLCSDGLSGMVDNPHIERTVSNKTLSLTQRAEKLVAQANANGGLDNITVQLIEFKAPEKNAAFPAKVAGMPISWIAAVVTAVIVLGVTLWLVLSSGNSKEDSPVPPAPPVQTEDHRSPANKPEVKKDVKTDDTRQSRPAANTASKHKKTVEPEKSGKGESVGDAVSKVKTNKIGGSDKEEPKQTPKQPQKPVEPSEPVEDLSSQKNL